MYDVTTPTIQVKQKTEEVLRTAFVRSNANEEDEVTYYSIAKSGH